MTALEGAAPAREPLLLGRRIDVGLRALAFVALTLPLGALALATVLALALGATLAVVWIGLPMVLLLAVVCHRLAGVDRWLANRLLDTHLPPVPPPRRMRGTLWRRAMFTLSDRQLWRTLALPLVRLPLSATLLVLGIAPLALTAWLLSTGARGLAGTQTTQYLGPWELGPGPGVVLLLLAVPAAIVTIALLGTVRWVSRAVTRALLTRPSTAEGPIREMLAESLGDRTVSVAYWLPDRNVFVDESGRQVTLPEPGSGRAWTAVDRDGRRVAAIVHDEELDTSPELVQAAAAAAALALDNERLKADLRARVEELRVSRVRIVEAADAARRRIERDLHDGAQQRLVSLALDLRVLRARLRDTDAAPLIDDVADKLAVALAELRDLARGIHPAILTDRGLGPAIEALAARAPLPVETHVDTGGELTDAIEAAAYFTVAEGLTNVARYAQATSAQVDIRRERGDLIVVVEDDGGGGADQAAGTGLRGLQDRLAALDGTLEVYSPPGAGTRLLARIPCEAVGLLAEARDAGSGDGAIVPAEAGS